MWADSKLGFAGGQNTVNLFSKYNGKIYAVAFDNDTQPFYYRGDMMDDPKEQAAYSDKYGQKLRPPETWDEHAKISEFFTRPDKQMYGDISTNAPFWCVVNWNERFVCSAAPNNLYFKPDGSANVNTPAGIQAFSEMLRQLQYHEPGSLEKDWIAQYKVLGGGNGFMGPSFPNLTKILPGNPDYDTADVGKHIRTGLMPGRNVGGKIVRRPVIFYNISYGVNNHVSANRQLAAYLFLQWAGSSKIYTWLTFNPGGYQDPHHKVSFTRSVRDRELQEDHGGRVQADRAPHGAADHDPRWLRVPHGALGSDPERAHQAEDARAGGEGAPGCLGRHDQPHRRRQAGEGAQDPQRLLPDRHGGPHQVIGSR